MIHIDFYAILGADPHSLEEEIVSCLECKVSRIPYQGFSPEALVTRRQTLQAACDILCDPLARAAYDQSLRKDRASTIANLFPLNHVPGALYLLLESGQSREVLTVGERALLEPLSEPLKQDVVLAMVLTYLELYKEGLAFNPPDYVGCCEVLEKALELIKVEASNFFATNIRHEIEESLRAISPHCALMLIGLPLLEEYRSRRKNGIIRVQKLLSPFLGIGTYDIGGGFTCHSFIRRTLQHLTAVEQMDLLLSIPRGMPQWRYLEYQLALAFLCVAFLHKKPNLVEDAENIFLQLQKDVAASDFIQSTVVLFEFSFELSLCALVTGALNESKFWLGLADSGLVNQYLGLSFDQVKKNKKVVCGICLLLERWVTEFVYPNFRETKNVTFRLKNYYDPTVIQRLKGKDGKRNPLLLIAIKYQQADRDLIRIILPLIPIVALPVFLLLTRSRLQPVMSWPSSFSESRDSLDKEMSNKDTKMTRALDHKRPELKPEGAEVQYSFGKLPELSQGRELMEEIRMLRQLMMENFEVSASSRRSAEACIPCTPCFDCFKCRRRRRKATR